MISICAPTFDINGQIICQQGYAEQQSTGRRAKRVATLDLGAVLVDGGYSVADLVFKITIPSDPLGQYHQEINRMMAYHSTAVFSCSQGCFTVLLSALQFRNGQTIVTAEVLEVV
jgi:hypothetical protein